MRTRCSLAAIVAGACAAQLACSAASSAPGAQGDDASVLDATFDAVAADSGSPLDAGAEASLHGHCEPVTGPCDLVLQDCPAGQQCTTQGKPGGAYSTVCGATHPVQHIAQGYPCCPPLDPAGDPCLPGLQCIGDTCTGDAGGGRCTPYCCSGDDTPCGTSAEGFAGHCDVQVVDSAGKPLYDVCDYSPPCTPLQVLPCPPGYTCLVRDKSGSAKCAQIYNAGAPPAGEGAPCQYNNSCADGLMCFNVPGAEGGSSNECLMLCATGQGTPPFDAGALAGGPGTGGCNAGKTCSPAPQIFPPWLGVCVP